MYMPYLTRCSIAKNAILLGFLLGFELLFACPMCNADGKDISIPIIMTFLFVPYVLFMVVFFAIRHFLKKELPETHLEPTEA